MIRLDDDALHPAPAQENSLTHSASPRYGRESCVDVFEAHAQAGGLLAVDDEFCQRRRRQPFDINVLQIGLSFAAERKLILAAMSGLISLSEALSCRGN